MRHNMLQLLLGAMLILGPLGTVQAKSDDCFSLMRSFMKGSRKTEVTEQKPLAPKVLKAIKNYWSQADLTDEDLKLLLEFFPRKEKVNKTRLKSFITYLSTLNDAQKKKAITKTSEFFKEKSDFKMVKEFNKIQDHIEKKRLQQFEKELSLLRKKNPQESQSKLESMARSSSYRFKDGYEKLAFGCRASKSTPEKKRASQLFKKFVLGIGVTSSIAGYTYANYDKEFDAKWFGRLGYELTIGMVSNYLSAKILTNPNNTIIRMGLQRYLLARSFGVVDMTLYSSFFSGNKDEARARLEELKKDPKFQEEMKKLSTFLEEEGTLVKYKRMIIENIKALLRHQELAPESTGELHYGDFDFSGLKPEDLDDPEIQNIVIAAILAQEYEENRGKIISTGDVGADRFAFHAAYGLVMMPKDIYTSLYIYRVLCMGQMNPRAALMKAVGLYTLNRVVFDQLYYYSRRESINQ